MATFATSSRKRVLPSTCCCSQDDCSAHNNNNNNNNRSSTFISEKRCRCEKKEFNILSLPLLLPHIQAATDSVSTSWSSSAAALTPSVVPLPLRIIKNDLRRQYPIMLVNAINSGDSQMVLSFLDRYGNNNHRNNHYYYHQLQPNSSMNSSSHIHGTTQLPLQTTGGVTGLSLLQRNLLGTETTVLLHGKDPISKYFDCMMNLIPDYALHMYDIKVKTSSSYQSRDWCRLEFIFCLEGTKLYPDVDPGCIGKNVHDELTTTTISSSILSPSQSSIIPSVDTGSISDDSSLSASSSSSSSSSCCSSNSSSSSSSNSTTTDSLDSGPGATNVNKSKSKDHIHYFRNYSGELPVFSPRKQVVNGMIVILVNPNKQIERIEILGAPRLE